MTLNVRDELKSLSQEDLRNRALADRLPFYLLALNVSGSLNIGTMIRTAHLLGAKKVFVIGSTNFDRRSCVGSQNYTLVERVEAKDSQGLPSKEGFRSFIDEKKLTPLFIEQNGESLENMGEYIKTFPENPCLIMGTESNGIPTDFIKEGEKVYSIPQLGVMRSYNVATATSIALWEAYRALKSISH